MEHYRDDTSDAGYEADLEGSVDFEEPPRVRNLGTHKRSRAFGDDDDTRLSSRKRRPPRHPIIQLSLVTHMTSREYAETNSQKLDHSAPLEKALCARQLSKLAMEYFGRRRTSSDLFQDVFDGNSSSCLSLSTSTVLLCDAVGFSTRPRILFEGHKPYSIVHRNAAYLKNKHATGRLLPVSGFETVQSAIRRTIGDHTPATVFAVQGDESGFSHYLVEPLCKEDKALDHVSRVVG